MNPLEDWLDSESRLNQAIQNFLEHSRALRDGSSFHHTSSSAQSNSVEDSILRVKSRLSSIDFAQRGLSESRVILNNLVNKSRTLVPVNILPAEILSQVFKLVTDKPCCYRKSRRWDALIVLSSVCVQWRRVMLQTSTLWTHVDFGMKHDRSVRSAWLERSSGAPVHLHFRYRNNGRKEEISSVIATLTPYAARISSISFQGPCGQALLQAIFDMCSLHRSSTPISSLEIALSSRFGKQEMYALDWPITSLTGLVELKLSEHGCATLNQLLALLSVCSGLQMLRVRDLLLASEHSEETHPPIRLPLLRCLDIHELPDIWASRLLSQISAKSPELHLGINVSSNADFWTAFLAFTSRSHVTSLCLWQSTDEDLVPVDRYVSSAPFLRSLVLCPNQQMADEWLDALTVVFQNRTLPRCPELKNLALVGFSLYQFEKAALDTAIVVSSLQSISFVSCNRIVKGDCSTILCDAECDPGCWDKWIKMKVPRVYEVSNDPRENWDDWDDFVETRVMNWTD